MRAVISVYLFVSFFDILFFIRAISRAARDVKNDLREMEKKIDIELDFSKDDKDYVSIADEMNIKWYNGWRYLFHSIIPIWHLLFFYTFLTHGSTIEEMFYIAFRGRAEKYVETSLKELMEEIFTGEDNNNDGTGSAQAM